MSGMECKGGMGMKERMTNKIKKLVEEAKAKMPEDAVNMRLYEEFHTTMGPLQTYCNRTSIDCAYFDDEGKVISRKEIARIGTWQISEPANYILYNQGLWKPYEYDRGEKLKTIRQRYETLLNFNSIYPIDGLTSPEYDCKKFCDRILKGDKNDTLHLTFILDYDFAENRTDMKFNKKEYSIKGKVKYGSEELEIPHMWATEVHMIYGRMITKLNEGGFDDILIHYDMKSEDRKKIFNSLRWANITFH